MSEQPTLSSEDHIYKTAMDAYMRLITLFDQDETAGSFLSDDGEGGFVGGVCRMAREIERLRAVAVEDKPTPQTDLMGSADAQLEQAGRDIRILLTQIEFLEELTGEKLEGEDAGLVEQIRQAWPALATEGKEAGQARRERTERIHSEARRELDGLWSSATRDTHQPESMAEILEEQAKVNTLRPARPSRTPSPQPRIEDKAK